MSLFWQDYFKQTNLVFATHLISNPIYTSLIREI